MITPLVVIAICFLKNYTIYALHLGTVVGLLMQSRFTLFCQIQYKKEVDFKSISFFTKSNPSLPNTLHFLQYSKQRLLISYRRQPTY